jgi:hypothetical protein
LIEVCGRLAGNTDSGAAPVVKKAVPARPTVSTGSGIVITPNGLILTNEHVVRQCDSLQVVLDSTRTVKATLLAADTTDDLSQNINFAIRGDVVRSFLEAQHVAFTASSVSAKLENTEIAKRGAAVTVLVRCIRESAAAQPPATPASP